MSKEYKKAVEANRKYNYERKIMNDIYMRDIDREKRIESIFNNAFFNVENEINRLYMSYAKTEGISVKEAKKRASEMDVKRFQDMAKKAVENKDFSAKANYWLKIYNLKMRVSRYELMKASISLEIQNMYNDSVNHIHDVLEEEILNEIENQAGILAPSFEMTKDDIEKIINMDFQGKNFSKRVWDKRDGYYRIAEKEIFKSLSNIFVHKMGYQKEMSRLSNTFKASKSQVLRLLKTEVSRANSQARDKMYKENGFTHYRYVCEPGACPICKPMDNKVFKLEDREIGVNAAPMHPNCRCRDYGIIEMFKNGKSNINNDEVFSELDEKYYRKFEKDKKNTGFVGNISYTEVIGSAIKNKTYVSDKVKHIKPKDMHETQLLYDKAAKKLGLRNLPGLLICDDSEFNTDVLAAYNMKYDIIRVRQSALNKKQIIKVQSGNVAASKNPLSTYVHELYHFMDLKEYKELNGIKNITSSEITRYIDWREKQAQKLLNKIGISKKELTKISKYANISMNRNKMDEVFTEYKVDKLLK